MWLTEIGLVRCLQHNQGFPDSLGKTHLSISQAIQTQFIVRRSESQASDYDEVDILGITCEFLSGRK